MQEKIDEIQNKYREWCLLLPELEADIDRWKRAVKLIRDMERFYSEDYCRFDEAIEKGAVVNLKTQGEYSIMSEDTLWDAYGDFQRLAWQRLRLAADALDPENV
ncbi:DUF4298 domain-containing protein [Neisseria animalis]|uniref:DUF4298 domain-containing protein n=1 Tax=Neisseria animalis TaxID=492 RepID=A0A5P3MTP4_NEIAN|nr:DUF4298 domain-containing protein [Neisseria animalis]QEY24977.1 DUF4298 domain-containing protein [Neisseria animalis]ROW32108.1 DUF4298 domain-containing protein [Neisseria animalis]